MTVRTPPTKPSVNVPPSRGLRGMPLAELADYTEALARSVRQLAKANDDLWRALIDIQAGEAQEIATGQTDVYARLLAVLALSGKGVI